MVIVTKMEIIKQAQTHNHGGLQWVQRATMMGMQCLQTIFFLIKHAAYFQQSNKRNKVFLCPVNETAYQVLLMESNQNHLQHQPVCKKIKSK